ncbi:unnamed protein product [Rhizophagus irregularis]|uniref:Uncharacterized protein n=1 Tax=Rhizophagus irregularis TaxID=588596 RepID=A0A916E3S1_9GLOM|nr:unnamed protein product [Rhizophagus irregularis]CAB5108255.1 unnamed protein product [Rhizophagus irregularis]CAB5349948.1 unnamed protein product [Rhizophagus irregularis]
MEIYDFDDDAIAALGDLKNKTLSGSDLKCYEILKSESLDCELQEKKVDAMENLGNSNIVIPLLIIAE